MTIPRGAEFHEHIASQWAAGYARGSFKRRLAVFNSILDCSVVAGQRWLDLGCGAGVLTAELVKRGAQVVALDGSPTMLEAAQHSVPQQSARFIQGNVQSLLWSEDAAFDGVLCSSVIEYVDDPNQLLREISRILKDGGSLIISMPPQRSLLRILQKIVRQILTPFGIDKFAYLSVSTFEVNPNSVVGWLGQFNLHKVRISSFDPVLPDYLLKIFRPALLIYEAKKSDPAA